MVPFVELHFRSCTTCFMVPFVRTTLSIIITFPFKQNALILVCIMLLVGSHESTAGEDKPRFSLWETESLTTFPMYPTAYLFRLKLLWALKGCCLCMTCSMVGWSMHDRSASIYASLIQFNQLFLNQVMFYIICAGSKSDDFARYSSHVAWRWG
jgi:hypothetical protein